MNEKVNEVKFDCVQNEIVERVDFYRQRAEIVFDYESKLSGQMLTLNLKFSAQIVQFEHSEPHGRG
jgi:hypothetical protein